MDAAYNGYFHFRGKRSHCVHIFNLPYNT